MTATETFALNFNPEDWPAVRRFGQFVGPPFEDPEVTKGARGAASHLRKYEVLAGLASRIAPTLVEDEVELDRDGHSPASRSRECAALIETLVCELYASLDGVRRTLFGAYRNVRGVQNKSTERLFRNASSDAYGPEFPKEISSELAAANSTWFRSLRELRTELTHGDIGSCHLDRETGNISYMHGGLGTSTRALVVEDVVTKVNDFAMEVSVLVEKVFAYLYTRLDPVERPVLCGIYKAHMYERTVTPEERLTFHSGSCVSRVWFESVPDLACPLANRCGAYQRETKPTST